MGPLEGSDALAQAMFMGDTAHKKAPKACLGGWL